MADTDTHLYISFYGEKLHIRVYTQTHHTSKNKICHKVEICRRGAGVKVSITEKLQQVCSPQEVGRVRKKAPPACWNMSEPPERERESAGRLEPGAAGKVWERKCGAEVCCAAADNSGAKGQQLLQIRSAADTRQCSGASAQADLSHQHTLSCSTQTWRNRELRRP